MPIVPFAALPDDARVWVFAASSAVGGARAGRLLAAVDGWLSQWSAHGEPLTCARDWRNDHFLAIGVDQSAAGASGCSVDALFRVLQQQQGAIGTSLVGGARIFFRDPAGAIQCVDRDAFARLLSVGAVGDATPGFDTTITSLTAYRSAFERPCAESWHRDLALPAASSASQPIIVR